MYELIDRPRADLPQADRFLLDAMRVWVHALTLAGEPAAAVSARFDDDGDAFDAMMRRLDRHSTGTLTFQRPCHPTVEEDEAVILAIRRLLANGHHAQAADTMRLLVEPNAANDLLQRLSSIAGA